MQATIEKKLSEIYHILKPHKFDYYSLHTDSGGKLLFLYEYAKYTQNQDIIEVFEQELAKFVENFSNTPSATFCNGIMGNLWLLEFFKRENIIDDLLLEIKDELNASFIIWGESFTNTKNFDFLHGLIGLLYAGSYCEIIDQSQLKKFTDTMLMDIKSENSKNYFLDWMPPSEYDEAHQEKINLGLAHGIPAAMISLAQLSHIDSKYKEVAISIGHFIISYKQVVNSDDDNLYGTTIFDKSRAKTSSRLGWCYGDLGIALAFWQVGKLLGYPMFKTEALEIMRHAAKRKDLIKNAVNDCGLCHGSAGIAQIFRRFYWESSEKIFKDAADYWTQITLDMATHENGLAGYCVYRATENTKWITDYGLLEGIGGIGLSLLSALQKEPSDWDQSLMMSSK